jgi:hypothetical protein
MLVFIGLLLSYMLVTAGIVYDMINEPPAIGSAPDANGKVRPVTVLPHRINAQYIIEGLSAGLLYCVGGIGFMFLLEASDRGIESNKRLVRILIGAGLTILAYGVCIMFLRQKLPGYLN